MSTFTNHLTEQITLLFGMNEFFPWNSRTNTSSMSANDDYYYSFTPGFASESCCWYFLTEWEKTAFQKEKEQSLLDELISVVNKRDAIVAQIEQQQQRYVKVQPYFVYERAR